MNNMFVNIGEAITVNRKYIYIFVILLNDGLIMHLLLIQNTFEVLEAARLC